MELKADEKRKSSKIRSEKKSSNVLRKPSIGEKTGAVTTNLEDGVVGEPPVGVDEGDGEDEGREVLEEVDVDPAGEGAEGT